MPDPVIFGTAVQTGGFTVLMQLLNLGEQRL